MRRSHAAYFFVELPKTILNVQKSTPRLVLVVRLELCSPGNV